MVLWDVMKATLVTMINLVPGAADKACVAQILPAEIRKDLMGDVNRFD